MPRSCNSIFNTAVESKNANDDAKAAATQVANIVDTGMALTAEAWRRHGGTHLQATARTGYAMTKCMTHAVVVPQGVDKRCDANALNTWKQKQSQIASRAMSSTMSPFPSGPVA